MKKGLLLFVVGSVITLVIAFLLIEEDRPLDAAALILFSPFPCPPGLPC